jgi:hypothetical protein
MKKDLMKRKVQRTYRNKMQSKKKSRRQTLEAGVVLLGIALLFTISEPLKNEAGRAYRVKREQAANWVIPASILHHELMEFDGYTGIAVDTHPKPVRYIVKTSLENGAASVSRMMEEAQFLIEEVYPHPKKEGYQIIVRGKDNLEIDSETYPASL